MMDDQVNRRCPECGLILFKEVSQCPRCSAIIEPMAGKPPMVERVYEHELIDRAPRERKDIKRIAAIIFILVVVACLVLTLSYYFLIPRIELKVITVYKESSGLVINLDSKVENQGTLDIQHYTMNITILNSSNEVVAKGDYYIADINPHSSQSFDNIYFYGDQYENYRITIKIHFESSGKDYSKTYTHTIGQYMLVRYEDEFMKWGG